MIVLCDEDKVLYDKIISTVSSDINTKIYGVSLMISFEIDKSTIKEVQKFVDKLHSVKQKNSICSLLKIEELVDKLKISYLVDEIK